MAGGKRDHMFVMRCIVVHCGIERCVLSISLCKLVAAVLMLQTEDDSHSQQVFCFCRTYLASVGLHLASGRPLHSIPPSAYVRAMSKSDAGSTSSKLTSMSVLSKLSAAALEAELERRKAAKGGQGVRGSQGTQGDTE